jgi:hypothetical protein
MRRRDSTPIARRLAGKSVIGMTGMVDRMRGVTALSAGKPLVGMTGIEAADRNNHVKLWHGFLL